MLRNSSSSPNPQIGPTFFSDTRTKKLADQMFLRLAAGGQDDQIGVDFTTVFHHHAIGFKIVDFSVLDQIDLALNQKV